MGLGSSKEPCEDGLPISPEEKNLALSSNPQFVCSPIHPHAQVSPKVMTPPEHSGFNARKAKNLHHPSPTPQAENSLLSLFVRSSHCLGDKLPDAWMLEPLKALGGGGRWRVFLSNALTLLQMLQCFSSIPKT